MKFPNELLTEIENNLRIVKMHGANKLDTYGAMSDHVEKIAFISVESIGWLSGIMNNYCINFLDIDLVKMGTPLKGENLLAIYYFDRAYEYSELLDKTGELEYLIRFFDDMNQALFLSNTSEFVGLIACLRARYVPPFLQKDEVVLASNTLQYGDPSLERIFNYIETPITETVRYRYTIPLVHYYYIIAGNKKTEMQGGSFLSRLFKPKPTKEDFYPIFGYVFDVTLYSYSPFKIMEGIANRNPLIEAEKLRFYPTGVNPKIFAATVASRLANQSSLNESLQRNIFHHATEELSSSENNNPRKYSMTFEEIESFVPSLSKLGFKCLDELRYALGGLIGKGHFDLSLRNEKGQTLLHVASQRGDITIVTWMLSYRKFWMIPNFIFDVNAKDLLGDTPLHSCARCDNPFMGGLVARDLVKNHGADPNLCNLAKQTPEYLSKELRGKSVFSQFLSSNLGSDDGTKDGPFIFLSWTRRLPREESVMKAVMRALTKKGVPFFDFSAGPDVTDDPAEAPFEIHDRMVQKTISCDFSIEIISSEIIGSSLQMEKHPWIQVERGLLKEFAKKRIFLVIDSFYMSTRGASEENILRLDASFGVVSGVATESFALKKHYKERLLEDAKVYNSAAFSNVMEDAAEAMVSFFDGKLTYEEMTSEIKRKWPSIS